MTTPAGRLSDAVRDVVRRKRKYWAKVLSDQAIQVNLERGFQLLDYNLEIAWDLNLAVNLTELGLSISFDFPPIEFEFLPLFFDFELPDAWELMAGILIKFKEIDLTVEFPWLKEIDLAIDELFEEVIAKIIKETRPRKSIYDRSRYDRCYYDPPVTMEFMKKWMAKAALLYKHGLSHRIELDSLAEIEGHNPYAVGLPFHRIALATVLERGCFILGVSRLGEAPLSDKCEYEVDNLWLGRTRVRVETVDQAMLGFVLGFVPLGFGFVLPVESKLKLRKVVDQTGYEKKMEPGLFDLVRKKVAHFASAFRFSMLGFANWQTAEERRSPLASERTELYGWSQAAIEAAKAVVDPLLDRLGITGPVRAAYYAAALDLASRRRKRHGAGYEVWQGVVERDYFRAWLEKWKQRGLDEDALLDIADFAVPQLVEMLDAVRAEAARLRLRRQTRALLLRYLGRYTAKLGWELG